MSREKVITLAVVFAIFHIPGLIMLYTAMLGASHHEGLAFIVGVMFFIGTLINGIILAEME